ncbi:MAG: M48 family metalloprotease [Candidatus Aenigmarchaeota archaeon]|nr:M48 family metalloprotease [Candidatus Aenigmarchaeota archaeon]
MSFILRTKMFLIMTALFAIVYALVSVAGWYLGLGNFAFYAIFATVLMFVQYMLGPKIVNWSMKVKYVSKIEEPKLHQMIEELARKAKIPKPRIGISETQMPNAFAFGRWMKDSRVCVTRGILSALNEDELRAVLGHEISHLKNRDVLTITIISVIPMIAWHMAWSFMWSGGGRENRGNAIAIGLAAFGIYILTNLLVLYASRVREYYADRGSVALGSKPSHLASALFKLVYGAAKTPKSELKKMEGMKAFFASDPSRAGRELNELKSIDTDLSGDIDENELQAVRVKKVAIKGTDKMMELLSTHPNMLKRIKALSQMT